MCLRKIVVLIAPSGPAKTRLSTRRGRKTESDSLNSWWSDELISGVQVPGCGVFTVCVQKIGRILVKLVAREITVAQLTFEIINERQRGIIKLVSGTH